MKPIICGDNNALELKETNFSFKELSEGNVAETLNAPYVVICSSAYLQITTIIKLFKLNSIPAIYLKPIFVVHNNLPPDIIEYLDKAVDKVISKADYTHDNLDNFAEIAKSINHNISQLPNNKQPTDNNAAIKALRYMYTRKCMLIPYKNTHSCLGYTYPCIDFFFDPLNRNLINLVLFLEKNHLISGEFVDRVFSCTNCSSGFINFREICTKCKSANIKSQEVIHHFRCAYMGPAKDFTKGDKLVCPKCKRTLKLIGNDYEKPSAIYHCLACNNTFQEPDIETVCYNCGQENLPDDLFQLEVKKYKLEPIASNAVLYGIKNILQRDVEKSISFIKYGDFVKSLKVEIERIKRFKLFKSTLCLLKFKELDKIYLSMGGKFSFFMEELSDIINNILRASDLISLYSESAFFVLMTHTEKKNAEIAFTRLQENIAKLVKENLNADLVLETYSLELQGKEDPEQAIKELLQNAFH